MKDNIIIDEKFRDYLESLDYEKRARLNLIIFMLTNDMANHEMFEKIQDEYHEFFIQYELAKKQFENLYIAPRYKTFSGWNLDFRSKEVTVYAEEN